MTDENQKLIVDLYIRVSTERQANEGDSLDEQEKELKQYCEFRKFEIRNILIERGKSGGNTNRPEYQKLLKDVKEQKIKAVVVKKIDRLSRSLLDFEEFMRLLQKHDVEFISIKESFDTTSAMGKAMLRIALIFAQLEREQTSERLVDVLEYRASLGQYNGGIPSYGYTNINKELVPYAKEVQIVGLIFKEFLDNKSTVQITKFLNDTGLMYRKNMLWDPRQVQRVLQNPIYIGKTRWHGKLFQGVHQPIIAENTFLQVEEIFKKRYQVRGTSVTQAILQKLIFCGNCGSPMTTSYCYNKFKTKYYYYRCTESLHKNKGTSLNCNVKYAPLKTTQDRVINLLLTLSEEQFFQLIENKVLKHNQSIETEIEKIKDDIKTQETKIITLKGKKEQYMDSLITGKFTSAERLKINTRLDEMTLEEKQLNSKLIQLQYKLNQHRDTQINLSDIKQNLITFKTDYDLMKNKQLREYITMNIEKIIYFSEKLEIKFKFLSWIMEFKV
jgi:site-specific DNA recombinase